VRKIKYRRKLTTCFFAWLEKFPKFVNPVCEDHAVDDGLKIKY